MDPVAFIQTLRIRIPGGLRSLHRPVPLRLPSSCVRPPWLCISTHGAVALGLGMQLRLHLRLRYCGYNMSLITPQSGWADRITIRHCAFCNVVTPGLSFKPPARETNRIVFIWHEGKPLYRASRLSGLIYSFCRYHRCSMADLKKKKKMLFFVFG